MNMRFTKKTTLSLLQHNSLEHYLTKSLGLDEGKIFT